MTDKDKNNYLLGQSSAVTSFWGARSATDDAAYLLPHLKPSYKMLDVGCGPGSITVDFILSRAIDPAQGGSVTGVDLPPSISGTPEDVIAQAAERAKKLAPAAVESGALLFQHGNVYDLHQFADATFDVVHAHQVFLHLPESVRALHELKRVLKPGGIFATRDAIMRTFTILPSNPLLEQWTRFHGTMLRLNGSPPNAGAEQASWALAAGFKPHNLVLSTGTETGWNLRAARPAQWRIGFSGDDTEKSTASAPADGKGTKWTHGRAAQSAAAWASILREEGFRTKCVERIQAAVARGEDGIEGVRTLEQVDALADAWDEWAKRDDAFFTWTNGEMVAYKDDE